MKIDRLSSLLSSLYSNSTAANSAKKNAEAATTQSEDAVRVSNSLPQGSTEQSRAQKVADIKERVQANEYVVDSEKTATALLRDLF